MMEITVSLTDLQLAALSTVMTNPDEWLQNAIDERARLAYESILRSETERMMRDPGITEIPANPDEIVLAYVPETIQPLGAIQS